MTAHVRATILVLAALAGGAVAVWCTLAARPAAGQGDPQKFWREDMQVQRHAPRFQRRQQKFRGAIRSAHVVRPLPRVVPRRGLNAEQARPISQDLPGPRALVPSPFTGAIVIRKVTVWTPPDDPKPVPRPSPRPANDGFDDKDLTRRLIVIGAVAAALTLTALAIAGIRRKEIAHV